MGIGDLLGLEGFSAIAQTTIHALNAHPDKALAIGRLAVESLQAAQVGVMEGDRTQGGMPSAALLALAGASPALEQGSVPSNDPEPESVQPLEPESASQLEPEEDALSWFEPQNLDQNYDAWFAPVMGFPVPAEDLETLSAELSSLSPDNDATNDTTAQEFTPAQNVLEDVFGQFSFGVESDSSLVKATTENNAALEDVFGQFSFAIEPKPESESESELESESSPAQQNVDNQDALEDIFGLEAMDFALAQDWEIFPVGDEVNSETDIDLHPELLLEQPLKNQKSS